ncbi:MAG: hypothetical protein LBV54_03015 [Puniceicoccales bacterium]|nr:hypothetical protein [Puniceicoccales bacterium]
MAHPAAKEVPSGLSRHIFELYHFSDHVWTPRFSRHYQLASVDAWTMAMALGHPLPETQNVPEWEPIYMPDIEIPAWDWELQTSSIMLRDTDQAVLTTLSPVMFSVLHPINIHKWETFRPVLSAGVGVLSQMREGGVGGDEQYELRTMFHVGVGAEWRPLENVIFHLDYDYSRIPGGSALNPDIPEQGHSIQLGVEVKF